LHLLDLYKQYSDLRREQRKRVQEAKMKERNYLSMAHLIKQADPGKIKGAEEVESRKQPESENKTERAKSRKQTENEPGQTKRTRSNQS